MVALLVALLFISFLLADYWLHRSEIGAYGRVVVPAERFPMPDPGTFVTSNHLAVIMAQGGRMIMTPDSFLKEAVGHEGRIVPCCQEEMLDAGEALYEIELGDRRLAIPAPFPGKVLAASGETVFFAPKNLDGAVRGMKVGEAVSRWWDLECRRLSRMLGETRELQTVLADGGRLASGYLAHLEPAEQKRFERIFLLRVSARRNKS